MKDLLLHPLFWLGVIIRVTLMTLPQPLPETDWYLPFMDITSAHFSLNPWEIFLSNGGNGEAFPYGYVMWLAFLPLTYFCKFAELPLHYGYQSTLMLADIGLMYVIRLLLPTIKPRLLLGAYWLSPIILLATYYLGMNDLIPVLLLTLGLYYTKKLKLFYAGILCGAAVSAKLSMVLAVPFFVIYLFRNNAMRRFLLQYAGGLAIAVIVFAVPFIMSASAVSMLVNNPEMGKPYQFSLKIDGNNAIYILPLAYLLMLYMIWQVRRVNFQLFNILLGIVFLLVVLLTSSASGWFIWVIPLLVLYQSISDRKAVVLVAAFSLLYVAINLPLAAGVLYPVMPLMHTILAAVGVVLILRIWREAVSQNDYFRLSRKPFAIGIAGDSGAGKNTYANALEGLFGKHSVVHVSGDDYHLWDRHNPMWKFMTHLNPLANDLERFSDDVMRLFRGKYIFARHYDHETGKASLPRRINSTDFIIASGLHALYTPILRDCYTIKIYLDIDEDLRRHLKIKRDVNERGHDVEAVLATLDKREPDAVKFIRTQAAHADLIMKLQATNNKFEEGEPLRLRLIATSRSGMNEVSLSRVLIGICGLHVDVDVNNEKGETSISIEGEVTAEDIAISARIVAPRIMDFLDIEPEWQQCSLGLMQLITLSHIDQILNRLYYENL